jgi:hypothetical protein
MRVSGRWQGREGESIGEYKQGRNKKKDGGTKKQTE